MRVRLLHENYLNLDSLYKDFLSGEILNDIKYFSQDFYDIGEVEPFPIYMASGSRDKINSDFMKAFEIIERDYIMLNRDIIMDQRFWHSLYLLNFRDYILAAYPEVKDNYNKFKNILIKKFDWENYIYKSVIAVQYVTDNLLEIHKNKYYNLILDNLDVYNYLIKYRIFCNDKFLLDILKIIDKHKISDILKSQIKGREDLGEDERYGRRVIFEFNKNYPVIMSPMMTFEKIEELFFYYLNIYYDAN